METFEFNQDFLQRAKDISLADMLDSPFCQAWVMSCISNCVVNYDKFPECGDQDEFLHYKLNRILNYVPREEKMELFRQCHQMIAERKQYMQEEASAGASRLKKTSQNQHGGERHRSSRLASQREGSQPCRPGPRSALRFGNAGSPGYTPQDLAALVSRCNRVSNLPRSEVERLVHKVFVEIMSGSREAANLGL